MDIADPLPYTSIAARPTGDTALDALHEAVRRADDGWRRARAQRADEDTVRKLATAYAGAAAEYQRKKWGRVVQRVSVAALLR
jgi:hypothetical protein